MTHVPQAFEEIIRDLKTIKDSLKIIRDNSAWRELYTSAEVQELELETDRLIDLTDNIRHQIVVMLPKYGSSTIGSDSWLTVDVAGIRAQVEAVRPAFTVLASKTIGQIDLTLPDTTTSTTPSDALARAREMASELPDVPTRYVQQGLSGDITVLGGKSEELTRALKTLEDTLALIYEDPTWREAYTSREISEIELSIEDLSDKLHTIRQQMVYLVPKYWSSTIGTDSNLIVDLSVIRAKIEQCKPSLELLASKTIGISGATLPLRNTVDVIVERSQAVIQRVHDLTTVHWSNVTNKPTAFTPASHEHDYVLSLRKLNQSTSLTGNVNISAGTNVTIDQIDATNTIEITASTGGGIDHGALGGLGDDDHPQYVSHDEIDSSGFVRATDLEASGFLTEEEYQVLVGASGFLNSAVTSVAVSGQPQVTGDVLFNTDGGITFRQVGQSIIFSGSLQAQNVITDHNDLDNIQGGQATEYYHLTEDQETRLTDGNDASTPTQLHHHDGRYYTQAEIDASGFLDEIDASTIDHGDLSNLNPGNLLTHHTEFIRKDPVNLAGSQNEITPESILIPALTLNTPVGGITNTFQIYNRTSDLVLRLSPFGTFEWNSNNTTQNFVCKGDTDNELFYVKASNNTVGIGTSSVEPTYKFEVDGTAYAQAWDSAPPRVAGSGLPTVSVGGDYVVRASGDPTVDTYWTAKASGTYGFEFLDIESGSHVVQAEVTFDPATDLLTITPIRWPTASGDAVNKAYVDSAAGGTLDHGALAGLADDDHTQYLLINGTRDMAGTLTMSLLRIALLGDVDISQDDGGFRDYQAVNRRFIDALGWGAPVQTRYTASTPPLPWDSGERYIVGRAIGVWAGELDSITEYDGTNWQFWTPIEGNVVYYTDTGEFNYWDGASWDTIDTSFDHGNLQGLTDDDHTQYVLRQPTADVVINDAAATYDFRFEGNAAQYLLFLDASDNSVNIGVTDATAKGARLAVQQKATISDVGDGVNGGVRIQQPSAASAIGAQVELQFCGWEMSDAGYAEAVIGFETSSNAVNEKGHLYIATRNVTTNTSPLKRMTIKDDGTIDCSGNLLINTTSNITAESSNYNVQQSDEFILASGTMTVNLPTAAGIPGQVYHIKKLGTGILTIEPDGSETIDGDSDFTTSVVYESISIVSHGGNWHVF